MYVWDGTTCRVVLLVMCGPQSVEKRFKFATRNGIEESPSWVVRNQGDRKMQSGGGGGGAVKSSNGEFLIRGELFRVDQGGHVSRIAQKQNSTQSQWLCNYFRVQKRGGENLTGVKLLGFLFHRHLMIFHMGISLASSLFYSGGETAGDLLFSSSSSSSGKPIRRGPSVIILLGGWRREFL